MPDASRTDLFTHVHIALRHGLFTATETLARTDWSDPREAASASATWAELDQQLQSHAYHEDAFIFPMLEARQPGRTRLVREDHEALEEQQRDVGLRIASAMATGDPTRGLDAYRALTRFTSAYLAHLLDEEQWVVPAIRAACDEDEVLACRRAFLATVPSAEAAVTQRWLLLSVDRSTRVRLLAGARSSLPPGAFDALVALAHDVLPEAERDHLDAALAAA